MKKFYIFFFFGFIILSALLYLSMWWFLAGVGIIVIFTIYHFYNARMMAMSSTVEELESQVEELQLHLDKSILKEERATKEAGQIRESKQELLTVIGHEIRTPMNGILGMTLLLHDTSLTKEQKEYADTIRNSGQQLLSTVNGILANDILGYSKLEKKTKKLDNIDFDLADMVEEVISLFAERTGKAGVDLLYEIDQDVPVQLNGDSKRLRDILMNLLENSVKFTRQGEIVISVHCIQKEDILVELSFEVRDSGVGIPEHQMADLFYGAPGKEFQTGEEQTGAGLIICRKQVELMGGHIRAKSRLGEGSAFIFQIPLSYSSKLTANGSQAKNAATGLEGRHVLIADDNLTSLGILVNVLKGWKAIPVGTSSVEEIPDILSQKNNIEVVLIDRDLLQASGMEIIKSLRVAYPHLPVILLNSPASIITREEEQLVKQIVTKPVRQHILKDAIVAVCNRSVAAIHQSEPDKLEENFSAQYPLQILIAEDNLINQKIAIKILTKLGYQPAVANNGREALDMTDSGNYDIILMDVQMPEMDGLEATGLIRESKMEKQPVIMAMTANVMQGDRDACLQAGMDDYISKPINLEELLSHLKKWALVIKERQK
ncbi:MAG: response regulator [Chitinophagaceae bacterium]|nr:response regulator [Chitinophagaceae bacterium]